MPIETFDEYAALDRTIRDAFEQMKDLDEQSEDYAQIVDQLVKLTKIRQAIAEMTLKMFEATTKKDEVEKTIVLKSRELDLKVNEASKPDRVSADTWAMVGANLAGILVIVGYERLNVVTSKALGFIMRSR